MSKRRDAEQNSGEGREDEPLGQVADHSLDQAQEGMLAAGGNEAGVLEKHVIYSFDPDTIHVVKVEERDPHSDTRKELPMLGYDPILAGSNGPTMPGIPGPAPAPAPAFWLMPAPAF